MASDRLDDAERRPVQRSESQSATRTSLHRGLDGEIQRVHLSTSRVRQRKRKLSASLIFLPSSLHDLASWFTHFITHRTLFHTYYEPWALVLVHVHNDLFERLTNQLEKLSPLPFRLKYTVSPNPISNSRIWSTADPRSSSLLTKKFNVRAWLRDRKTQVKISPKELSMFSPPPPPADPSSRQKISTGPSLKRH